MRVVIVGAGRGGLNVAVYLREQGHDVTIVDRDPVVTRRAFEEHGLVSLAGDATEPSLLHAAEAGAADAVLAMLHRDADNLAVAMLARQQGARRVMARMREPAYRPIYLAAGVTQVLSETDVLVGALALAVEHEAIAHSMMIGQGHAIAFEMVVRAGTWIVGRQVSEVATAEGFPSSCVVAGAAVDGVFAGARGNTTFAVDMRILLVVAKKELGPCLDFFLREG